MFLSVVATLSTHVHHHEEEGSILSETWALITDPAHALTEVFYSIVFEVIAIPLAILAYKKLREPQLRKQIHAEIDAEHGIDHSGQKSS